MQLLTPVVKAFLTEEGFNNANLGLQVLGGSGYTKDWPLEQLVRDARITQIYEGTNGIQAMDLVGRKLGMAGGRPVASLFGLIQAFLDETGEAPHTPALRAALQRLEEATAWIAANGPGDPDQAGAAATPYLRLLALTVIGYLWSRMAAVAAERLQAGSDNRALLESKHYSAQFYFDKILPESQGLLTDIVSGKESMMAFDEAHWAS